MPALLNSTSSRPKRFLDLGEQRLDGGRIAHVGRHHKARAVAGAAFARGLFELVRAAAGERHGIALPHQGKRDRFADAGAGAGDDRDFLRGWHRWRAPATTRIIVIGGAARQCRKSKCRTSRDHQKLSDGGKGPMQRRDMLALGLAALSARALGAGRERVRPGEISRAADPAGDSVHHRRRERCRRPPVGGQDEVVARHRRGREHRRRRRRRRQRRGRARAAGRLHAPSRRHGLAGHRRDRHQPSHLRSDQGFRADRDPWNVGPHHRGPSVAAGQDAAGAHRLRQGQSRASCRSGPRAPAP